MPGFVPAGKLPGPSPINVRYFYSVTITSLPTSKETQRVGWLTPTSGNTRYQVANLIVIRLTALVVSENSSTHSVSTPTGSRTSRTPGTGSSG